MVSLLSSFKVPFIASKPSSIARELQAECHDCVFASVSPCSFCKPREFDHLLRRYKSETNASLNPVYVRGPRMYLSFVCPCLDSISSHFRSFQSFICVSILKIKPACLSQIVSFVQTCTIRYDVALELQPYPLESVKLDQPRCSKSNIVTSTHKATLTQPIPGSPKCGFQNLYHSISLLTATYKRNDATSNHRVAVNRISPDLLRPEF